MERHKDAETFFARRDVLAFSFSAIPFSRRRERSRELEKRGRRKTEDEVVHAGDGMGATCVGGAVLVPRVRLEGMAGQEGFCNGSESDGEDLGTTVDASQ